MRRAATAQGGAESARKGAVHTGQGHTCMKWLAAGVHGAMANEHGRGVRIADAAMFSLGPHACTV